MSRTISLSEYVQGDKLDVVLVGGCFDILHIGHIRFLKAARKQGDSLVVALESDEFIRLQKRREPFHTQAERAEILAALRSVDTVILLPLLSTDEDYARASFWARGAMRD